MGIVPGTNISAGLKLMRGSWNARPYGPLYDLQVEGVANGTDFYFNKSKTKYSIRVRRSLLIYHRSFEWSLGRSNTPWSLSARKRDYDSVFWWRECRSVCRTFDNLLPG